MQLIKKTDIARWLIEKGFGINKADNDRCTPLMKAVQSNDLIIAEILIEYKAYINSRDKHGHSALFYAVEKRVLLLVTKLIVLRRSD